jgi:hypothetical protein
MSAFENMLAGYNAGTGIKRQREADERSQKFNALAGQAYGAQGAERDQFIGQAVGVDAQSGLALDKGMRGVEESRNETLVNSSRLLLKAPEQYRESIYQRIRPVLVERYGMQLPEAYDPTVGQAAQSIVDAYSPPKDGGMKNLRIGADGFYYAVQGNQFVSTGIKADSRTKVVEGANGYEIIDERAGSSNPVMAGGQQGAPIPQGGQQGPAMPEGQQITPFAPDVNIPQSSAEYAAFQAASADAASPNPTGQSFKVGDVPYQPFQAPAGSNTFGGGQQVAQGQQLRPRDPVQDAIAKRRAEAQIDLETLPERGRIEADAAAAKEAAKSRAELQQMLPQVETDSSSAMALIDKALTHPGRGTATGMSGALDLRNYAPGSDAKNFQVLLNQLKGKNFLQAFQSLRGGGAITQIEGTKAEEAIARLDRAQSDEEFTEALFELRDIAENAPTKFREKISATQQGATNQPARPASDAEYNALPSGALFVDPDDGKTYRKP